MSRRFFSPFHSFSSFLTSHFRRVKRSKPKMEIREENPEISSFPLLKLPLFPLRNIINRLDSVTVIELTFISSKFKRVVELVKLRVAQFEILLGYYYNSIDVYFDNGPYWNNHFTMDVVKYSPNDDAEWFETKNFTMSDTFRHTDQADKTMAATKRVMADENVMDTMERITVHLLSIVKPTWFKVRINRRYVYQNLFIWKYLKELDTLDITNIETSHANPSKIITGANCSFEVLPDDVSCRNVTYRMDKVPCAKINAAIKEWMAGKNEKLEDMQFLFENRPKKEYYPVFDGLSAVETKISREMMNRRDIPHYYTPYDRFMDIKRATDGRLATIVIYKGGVSMYVWLEKHFEGVEGSKIYADEEEMKYRKEREQFYSEYVEED